MQQQKLAKTKIWKQEKDSSNSRTKEPAATQDPNRIGVKPVEKWKEKQL